MCASQTTGHAATAQEADAAWRRHYLNEHYYPRSDVTAADRLAYFRSPRHLRLSG